MAWADFSRSRICPRVVGTHHPQGVESAQIIKVQMDALKYLVVMHVLQGQPHWVRIIGLRLPVLGKVADHGISAAQPGRPLAIFLHHQASKLVSICRACCRHLSHRTSSVSCSSSLEDDSSDSWKDVSSLGLGWHHFCCFGGVPSS